MNPTHRIFARLVGTWRQRCTWPVGAIPADPWNPTEGEVMAAQAAEVNLQIDREERLRERDARLFPGHKPAPDEEPTTETGGPASFRMEPSPNRRWKNMDDWHAMTREQVARFTPLIPDPEYQEAVAYAASRRFNSLPRGP